MKFREEATEEKTTYSFLFILWTVFRFAMLVGTTGLIFVSVGPMHLFGWWGWLGIPAAILNVSFWLWLLTR